MMTYVERSNQRINFVVIPTDFSDSLIFGQKRPQKCASSFSLNIDGDLVDQPVGIDAESARP